MKKLLLSFALLLFATSANAATCFWVGGTGSWSTANTASWASSSGGTPGTCAATGLVPKQAGDVATFDGASGGGTVTVDSTMGGTTIQSLVMGAFTGTIDFSVNNPSMTLGANGAPAFNLSGTGTRIIKMGSGTFTCKATSNVCLVASTTTGLTYTGGSATFNLVDNGSGGQYQQFCSGCSGMSMSGNTLTISSTVAGSGASIITSQTFLAINVNSPSVLVLSATATITNAFTWTASSSAPISIIGSSFGTGSSQGAIAAAAGSTINWAFIANVNFTTGSPTASNSFTGGNNTGITITGPSGGSGGGRIIGG